MLCVRKENIRVVAIIVSRKERRERKGLIHLLFTLALEESQVSLRLESAEAEWQTYILYSYYSLLILSLLHHPAFQVAGFAGDVCSYLDYLPAVYGKGQSISLLVYLRQSLLGRAIKLKLYDIDVLVGSYCQIYASTGSAVFL